MFLGFLKNRNYLKKEMEKSIPKKIIPTIWDNEKFMTKEVIQQLIDSGLSTEQDLVDSHEPFVIEVLSGLNFEPFLKNEICKKIKSIKRAYEEKQISSKLSSKAISETSQIEIYNEQKHDAWDYLYRLKCKLLFYKIKDWKSILLSKYINFSGYEKIKGFLEKKENEHLELENAIPQIMNQTSNLFRVGMSPLYTLVQINQGEEGLNSFLEKMVVLTKNLDPPLHELHKIIILETKFPHELLSKIPQYERFYDYKMEEFCIIIRDFLRNQKSQHKKKE